VKGQQRTEECGITFLGSSPYQMGEKTCLNTGRRRWTRVP
jgi:hypothetical protein